MPWVSAKKFICPPWWALPGLLWCALSYHLLLEYEILGFNRQSLSSWDVTPFQRHYIAMYCGISEMFWGTSDDCLELIVDGQEDSSSLCLTSFLVHFRMRGSSRIAFFLKCPQKLQAVGCLPMTHAKAGYNRVCWLCHTVWCDVVTAWQQDEMQDPVSKSLLSKLSLLLTIPQCKKLFTQMSHALLLVCPSLKISSLGAEEKSKRDYDNVVLLLVPPLLHPLWRIEVN